MLNDDFMQNLANVTAQMSSDMSIEQMRLLQDLVTKSLELKEAQAAFDAAIELEGAGDSRVSASLKEVREFLEEEGLRLSGSESVLLACYGKRLEGEDWMDTKRLNILLGSFGRKPSNTTKIVEILAKKGLVEVDSEALHAHKTYQLTGSGVREVTSLVEELRGSGGRDRLTMVG